MGYLVIKLHEGKNLEAKDHSGTSDPYVSFKLISNETQQVLGKAKSKVVKKNLNPQWNETLQLSISNNPKGHSLHIKIRDWNRIGSQVCMGEQTLNLEEWKATEERDLWLNLQNGNGQIHVTIAHKPDNKFKVLVSYQNEPLVEYNLLKGVKLATQLDLLCQLFNSGNPEGHTLQIKDSEQFITAELLADPKFEIPDNTVIRLMVKPNLQVDNVLQALKNETTQKKAIFDLKNQLQDTAFAEAFIAKDGIKAITKLITDSTGNTLAYALGALDACMSFGLGWDTLTPQEIDKMVSLLESQNLNVRSGALKVCSHLASSKNHGYPILNAAIKKLSNGLYQKLVSAFSTSDVHIQLTSLQFINAMLNSAPVNERTLLLDILAKENITKVLKDQLNTSDQELKSQIARYAKIKFELDKAPTVYDKENPEHEKMLMDLWTTLYPEVKLEARVCKQWKLLGFQGNDPATDFRGMGTLALKHLLYAAKRYNEDLRTMMQEQEENPETYYPVAVAGINLSKMLYDIFRDAENDADLKYIGMLFEHDHAVEEIYCESLFFFDNTWTEMEATYFNFSNVISIVADRIVDNLSQCKTLQEFRDKCGKGVGGSAPAANANNQTKKNKKKTTPFFKRIENMISSPKSTPNSQQKKQESLHQAVKEGNTKKVSDLIRDGANINELNETGNSPLHIAVINGNLDMVRLLLWKDAEVDSKNQAGWTPLHEATKNSSLEICAVLLHKNANPSAETSDGNTPFHYLVSRRFVDNAFHQEVMNDMLTRGVNINHNTNSNAETPLFYAVTKGLTDVVTFLIQHGADVNWKNKRGYTPLHIAILQGDKPVVEALLNAGADTTIPAKEGTPADLAKNNAAVLEVLSAHANKGGKPLPSQPVKMSSGKPLPVPGKKVLPPLPNNHPRASLKVTTPPVKKSESSEAQITCYHGQITREQAEQILMSQKKDSFLLRASSVRGCYAMTVYKPAANELTHFLVYPRSSGGYSIQDCDDTNTYANLSELITKSPIVKNSTPIPPKTSPGAPPIKTPVQAPAKGVTPPAHTENYYGTAPTITDEDMLKPKLQELQKMLTTALVDIEKPTEWAKTKPNLKKAITNIQAALN